MNRRCVIFGGGDAASPETVQSELEGGELFIAADSGYLHMEKLGIAPDLLIGDFDSAPEPDAGEKLVFPVEKDDTDLMLAVKEGLARGYDRFIIFGATGGRLDHTFAAVQTLAYLLDNGASGVIVSDTERIEMIDEGSYRFPQRSGYTFSLFSYSEKTESLELSGVKYCCKDAMLNSGFPLGVSNKITDSFAELSFKKGRLLTVYSRL